MSRADGRAERERRAKELAQQREKYENYVQDTEDDKTKVFHVVKDEAENDEIMYMRKSNDSTTRKSRAYDDDDFYEDKPKVKKAPKKTTSSKSSKTRKKKKKASAAMNIITGVLLIFCFSVFGYCVYEIGSFFKARSVEAETYKNVQNDIKNNGQKEDEPPDWGGAIDNPVNHGNGGDSDNKTPIVTVPWQNVNIDEIPYLNYDYSGLQEKNKDVKGWIRVPGPSSIYGLPISNAILQGDDDFYYLTHDAYGKENSNGTIFFASDEKTNLLKNKNTVIFGHAKNPYAFAGIKYLNNAVRWYANANNHFIKIQTNSSNTVWQIFSWYETTASGDYSRDSASSWSGYLNALQDRNKIDAFRKFEFDDDDKIITLVTCKGTGSKRVVMHAKLVKSK